MVTWGAEHTVFTNWHTKFCAQTVILVLFWDLDSDGCLFCAQYNHRRCIFSYCTCGRGHVQPWVVHQITAISDVKNLPIIAFSLFSQPLMQQDSFVFFLHLGTHLGFCRCRWISSWHARQTCEFLGILSYSISAFRPNCLDLGTLSN